MKIPKKKIIKIIYIIQKTIRIKEKKKKKKKIIKIQK